MALIKVLIEVDEETVLQAAESDFLDLDNAIDTELGWTQESGMSIVSWEYVEEK